MLALLVLYDDRELHLPSQGFLSNVQVLISLFPALFKKVIRKEGGKLGQHELTVQRKFSSGITSSIYVKPQIPFKKLIFPFFSLRNFVNTLRSNTIPSWEEKVLVAASCFTDHGEIWFLLIYIIQDGSDRAKRYHESDRAE